VPLRLQHPEALHGQLQRRNAIVSEQDLHEAALKLARVDLGKVLGKVAGVADSRAVQACDNPHTREWRNWQTRWT
jgi:hypothetical protein